MAIPSVDSDIREPKSKAKAKARHGLGLLALGALIVGLPSLAAAEAPADKQCGPVCQRHQRLLAELTRKVRSASPTLQVPPTATSPLALLAPALFLAPASTFTVTTTADVVDPGDGLLSLREAVSRANDTPALDAIRFASSLEGQTLVLTGGQLTVSEDLILDGDRDVDGVAVTIDGDDASRVLSISGTATDVALRGLDLTGGYSRDQDGGGILLGAGNSLQLTAVGVRGNRAGGYYLGAGSGGGIAVETNGRLTVINSSISGNTAWYRGCGGGIVAAKGSFVSLIGSRLEGNRGTGYRYGNVGGLCAGGSTINIDTSTIAHNRAGGLAGGILAAGSRLTINNSTVSGNNSGAGHASGGMGGGIVVSGSVAISNSTVTGNRSEGYGGAGIEVSGAASASVLAVSNSIIAGNFNRDFGNDSLTADDIAGTIGLSNGHNVFGSDVAGNVPGDRENVASGTVFATVDPTTGGGQLHPDGTIALRNNVANPAVSAGDPLAASALDQRGTARPLPAGSLPDLGAVEIDQPLSTGATANNDVRTGTNAANNLTGLAGNDYLKGLGGSDTMDGGPGGDLLDGGPGNDLLAGGTGLDLAAYPGSAAVVIDLSGTPGTARRGSETDTLIGIEGALGSSGNDTFKGDALNNEFQGKAGKDTMTGGLGRDSWDLDAVADSPAGATRDVVTDFAPGQDVIDLAGIDADTTVPGNQSFRWVAKATLTGAAQLGYFTTGGMTIVRASTDSDAAPELQIQLTGKKTLTEVDFRP